MKCVCVILVALLLAGCEKRVVNESTWGYDMFPEYHNLPRGETSTAKTKKTEQKMESGFNKFMDKVTPWD